VAIKRLQARGLSLAEVQARLLGLTDRKLSELARLPADGETAGPAGETVEAGRRRQAFWAVPPGPAAAAVESAAPRALTGVPLAEGVTLLLEAGRLPDEHDLEAVRAVAAPLLRLLRARRLLAGHEDTSKGETP
jgi:hypothetical protein